MGCIYVIYSAETLVDSNNIIVFFFLQFALFQNAGARRAGDKAQGKLYLQSMANSPPSKAIELAVELQYLNTDVMTHRSDCAALFNIPNMTLWWEALDVMWIVVSLLETMVLISCFALESSPLAHQQVPWNSSGCGSVDQLLQSTCHWSRVPKPLGLPQCHLHWRRGQSRHHSHWHNHFVTWYFVRLVHVDFLSIKAGANNQDIFTTMATSKWKNISLLFLFERNYNFSLQPSCPDDSTANGAKEHWNAYDSDGTEHTFCGWAWEVKLLLLTNYWCD
jgi:hypothetical protein